MEHQRKKVTIILITLLLHGAILALLLIFYTSPEHEWVYFDTSTAIQTPETIFSESLHQIPEPQQMMSQIPEQETWAELKPRASSFGSSMDMPEDDVGVESDESTSSENDEKTSEESLPITQAPETQSFSSEIGTLKNELKAAKVSPAKKKVSAQKQQAQKALASMTRGYLEQLKNDGENLIKTIGGDPNKMPSAEQLKYERYLAKIQWCLQNAHYINRDKCEQHGPVEATMRVYFTLNRNGKMLDLKIMQSSGDPFVDRYIRSLFEQASSSFPPLPAYIKEDPYQLLYTVMVCWNVASPICMGFMRE